MPVLNTNMNDETNSGFDFIVDSELLQESNRRTSHPSNLFTRRESNTFNATSFKEDSNRLPGLNQRSSISSGKSYNYYTSYLNPSLISQASINEGLMQSYYPHLSINNSSYQTQFSYNTINSSLYNNNYANNVMMAQKRLSEPSIQPNFNINTPEVKFNVTISSPKQNYYQRSNSLIGNEKWKISNPSEKFYTPFSEYTERELLKKACFMTKQQKGCRFLQDKIKNNPRFANEFINPEFLQDISDLTKDTFGNYFIQKLLEELSPENINLFMESIKNDFGTIAINSHGTRSIQKLIDCISGHKENIDKFNSLFLTNLMTIIKDGNGNHIVQKYFNSIEYPYNVEAFNIIMKNLTDIATDKNGCCVIQKCMDSLAFEMKVKLLDKTLGTAYRKYNREFKSLYE